MASQDRSLDRVHQAHRDRLLQHPMTNLPLQICRPSGENNATAIFGHRHRPTLADLKTAFGQLAAVGQRDTKLVEDRPMLLHEVEGQGGTPGPHAVEEPNLRIEAYRVAGMLDPHPS